MKDQLKKFVLYSLKRMARRRLKNFKGKIIAVTGSVGKTSTKEAISAVLNAKFRVKKSKGNMNSDFGLLLTILNIESGNRSALKWSVLMMKAFWHMTHEISADVLLLELGVDKPGDMDFLTSIIKPDIAVLTNVQAVHMAEGQFKNVDQIFHEKVKLLEALPDGGIALVNFDDDRCRALKGKVNGVMTFGKNNEADFWTSRVNMDENGIDFVAHFKEEKWGVRAPVLGKYQLYTLLPAVACGHLMGMSAEEIEAAVERYELPPGRMSVIEAINGAVILDSTYNSSPKAVCAALEVLSDVAGKRRRVAVLGNMNELGDRSTRLHEKVGEVLPEYVDLLLTVGKDAEKFGAGMKKVHNFKTPSEAAGFFKKEIKEKDIVLVKGSQNNVRLERFVKELMLEPERAKELLVRQSKQWTKL